jgi:hypothetical protein
VVAAARPARTARRVDLPGALAATLATGAVIYRLVTASSHGWDATATLVPPAAGLTLAGIFVAIERTAREPLVLLGLLARRQLLAGQLVMLAASGLLPPGRPPDLEPRVDDPRPVAVAGLRGGSHNVE